MCWSLKYLSPGGKDVSNPSDLYRMKVCQYNAALFKINTYGQENEGTTLWLALRTVY